VRVLIAEDNMVNLKLIERMVQKLGHEAFCVQNGAQVLTALKQEDYAVILMDLQMPGLSGLETTRRLRSELPAVRLPRIIAVTANTMDQTRVACLAAGMDDFLAKPIHLEDLAAALERRPSANHWIEREQLHRRLDSFLELGDQAFVSSLINIFVKDNGQRLQAIRVALNAEDYALAARLGHMNKGSAANMGAQKFQKLCDALQTACEQKDQAAALHGLTQADIEFSIVELELTQWQNLHPV
jgi:CheY-like chemotaxis protein